MGSEGSSERVLILFIAAELAERELEAPRGIRREVASSGHKCGFVDFGKSARHQHIDSIRSGHATTR